MSDAVPSPEPPESATTEPAEPDNAGPDDTAVLPAGYEPI